MKRIYLFEDEKVHRDRAISILKEAKYEVEASATSREALFDISSMQFAPDAAVLDIMDNSSSKEAGFELFDKLRQKWPSLPVIFLTSLKHGSAAELRALDLGAHWFISKRQDEDGTVLLAVLNRFLEDSGGGRVEEILNFPPLTINLGRRAVLWRGAPVDFADIQFEVLVAISSGRRVSPAKFSEIADLAGIRLMDSSEVDGDKTPEHYRNQTVRRHKADVCKKLQDVENSFCKNTLSERDDPLEISVDVIGTVRGHGYFLNLQRAD